MLMTRVLVVSNMYPPHHYGGYELSCRDVVRRWRQRAHAVEVLTTDMRVPGVADPPGERAEGVRRDLAFYWEDHRLLSPPLWNRLRIEQHNQAALATAVREFEPEVVSIWNMGAMSLGLITTLVENKTPIVLVVCDEWPCYAPGLDAWSRLWLDRPRLGRLVRRLTRVPTVLPDLGSSGAFCFVTDLMRRRAEERSRWQYPLATVVYSGIDEHDFPVRRAPVVDAWHDQWLYVGRIDPRKGIATAIDALSLEPGARLDIVGAGDREEEGRLRARAEAAGVAGRVSWSVVDRSDLRARYEAADVVLFPSTWDEPFGLIPVEAMACGTPVVATGTGGSAEFLVDGGNCVLFPPGDAAALAAATERIRDAPGLRRRIIEGGAATAAELTVGRLAECLEAWHVGAASGFRDGRPPDRPPPGRATEGRCL